MAIRTQCVLLDSAQMSAFSKELIKAGIELLTQELGYSKASTLERLLIEQVVLCQLRLYLWENACHSLIESQDLAVGPRKEWESLLSIAQRRYFRAIDTLDRMRRLNICVQVNIANDGSQQINIANQ
jgi:hypothetical protein